MILAAIPSLPAQLDGVARVFGEGGVEIDISVEKVANAGPAPFRGTAGGNGIDDNEGSHVSILRASALTAQARNFFGHILIYLVDRSRGI